MNKHTEEAAGTTRKINDVFWNLYQKKPISKITIAEIADAAQIHRATFYRHFADVYAVLEGIEQDLFQQLKVLDATQIGAHENLNSFGQKIYQLLSAKREYIHFLVVLNRDAEFSQHYKERLQSVVARVVTAEAKTAKNAAIMKVIYGVIIEFILQCIDQDTLTSDEIMAMVDGTMKVGLNQTLLDNFGFSATFT